MRSRALILGLLIGVVFACADAEPTPLPPDSALVGPGGGSFALLGVGLTIPPGALSQTVELRVSYAEQEVPAATSRVSRVYRFEPGGLHFQVPITVALPLTRAATSPRVAWSKEGELLAFDRLPTRVVANQAVAEVEHYSYGYVTDSASPTDGGEPDAEALDGPPADAEAEAGLPGDAGAEDLGAVEVGPDGSADATFDGGEPADLGSTDLGPGDGGGGDAEVVTITPPSGSTFARDACEAQARLLSSNAGPGAIWSEVAPFSGAASIDSDGTLYLDPTGLVISWPDETFAVEVVGPNGSAQASYQIAMNGVSRWIGPIFSGGLTDYSLSSTTTYAVRIAPPEADHPCRPRYRRVTNGPACPAGASAIQIDDQGWVSINGALAVGVYSVCFAAQWSTVELDRFEGQLNVVP